MSKALNGSQVVSTGSKALERVVSVIEKFLPRPSPSDADNLRGSNSNLFLLICSQLQRTHRLLEDFSKKLVLDWHGLIYEELYEIVMRIGPLLWYPEDNSILAEARGEHFLETLLDLRWWTWVIALQVDTLLTDPTLYDFYFGKFEGVFEVEVSSLPFGGDSVSRRLPSYSFELWQQATEGRLREILQCTSGGNRLRDHGQNEADMLLTEVRNINAEFPHFKINELGTTKFRDAGKPSSIGDYLPIDLTQDLLGASTTGYVIRTTCSNGEGGLVSCALKRINTMDDKPPDLARLWHPQVVHLIHHWREKRGLHCKDRERMRNSPFMTFLVMELMDGDLIKLMTRNRNAGVPTFPLHIAIDIMLQIAKGILYMHEMGVSHPHLKCDNILYRVELDCVRVKLGGFGCSRIANVDTKNRDVFCFGLTCLEILTGDDWSEDIYGADRVPKPIIPEMTPPILKHCISSCLSINLQFSEVVMLLLLAKCQIMQTYFHEVVLSTEKAETNVNKRKYINKAETSMQDLASPSTSRGGLNEVFHVHQLHPQLGEVSTSVPITLIFFHGFPKISEDWRMTWMTRDNKLVWPQKWLPEDLGGDIRVLSVSFDDHLNVSSNQTIENLLQILILSGTWELGGIEQAIILVGHSFGGVIIKSLVTEAQKLAQKTVVDSIDFEEVMKCKEFLKRLASIVFYSVPHAVTSTEFENYISGSSNTRVLQKSSLLMSLRKDDNFIPKMIQLSRDFESAVPLKTKILAFVEGKPMSKKCFLVSENSCEGRSLSWEWHKLDKDNHFEVCRPDSKSHNGYKILLNHLLKTCTYDYTSPTINVRRQSWKVIGTVFIAICKKFKKLVDKRNMGSHGHSDGSLEESGEEPGTSGSSNLQLRMSAVALSPPAPLRVVVGLDFGTTFSGFAYAHIRAPDDIFSFFGYPNGDIIPPYGKTLTASLYKPQARSNGKWHIKSWGFSAQAEYERDMRARRGASKLDASSLLPDVGIYIEKLKLHLASSSAVTKLPPWLSVEALITDYLREMGALILNILRDRYGAHLTKDLIQWCITVPSIWDNYAKDMMKTCMTGAGLVNGVDGSPHPLIMVLEPEAASFSCHKLMHLGLEVGDKLMVADIGGGISEIVVQEVVSLAPSYRVKEVTMSSGGLCGGTYVDVRFMEFLHKKIGPCLQECIDRNPMVPFMLTKMWERSFDELTMVGESIEIYLPAKVVKEWFNYDRRMGIPERDSYDELEFSYSEMQSILDPVVQKNLQLISDQLAQVGSVKVLVVVGGFARSSYLMEKIKRSFSGIVPQIMKPIFPASEACKSAVALALNPRVIKSRICKKTYGFSCTYKFEKGVDPVELRKVVDGAVKCRKRFMIFVSKGDEVQVDECISRIHRPVQRGQTSMRLELFSSDERNPRYVLGDTVKKEGEIVIDISGDMNLEKEREVMLSLFFGRSSLEIRAKAINFLAQGPEGLELPVYVDYSCAR